MNILTRILKELAQEFKMPAVIERRLFQQLFISKNTERKDNGEE